MKTLHVLILAAAILGAAWILRPAPVKQVSQAELQHREELERFMQEEIHKENLKRCVAAVGKTVDTLDRNDPKQETVFRKCMWPEESRSRLRVVWDKLRGMW